jgi:COP9 signalosome complex subunit 5
MIDDSIPEEKIKDFGMHYKHYYSLEIEYFMSAKDAEIVECGFNNFWKTVIESDRLIDNQEDYYKTLTDVCHKCKKLNRYSVMNFIGRNKQDENEETRKRVKELTKVSLEVSQATMQDCVKALAFQ